MSSKTLFSIAPWRAALLALLALLALPSVELRAQTAEDATVFMQDFGDRMLELFMNPPATAEERAQAERDFAVTELKRYEGLAASRTISQNDLESARRRARTAEAAVDAVLRALQVAYGAAESGTLFTFVAKVQSHRQHAGQVDLTTGL